jgi:hypothetical protein
MMTSALSASARTGSFGRRFAEAVAARDEAMLLSMFGDEVDFRALTPGRTWQERAAAAVVRDVVLGSWFEPSDVVERIEAAGTDMVGSRHRFWYRLVVTNPGGRFVVEQQAYADIRDGKITWMRVLGSGFVPLD